MDFKVAIIANLYESRAKIAMIEKAVNEKHIDGSPKTYKEMVDEVRFILDLDLAVEDAESIRREI